MKHKEDLSKFFPKMQQPRMSKPKCLQCFGFDSDYCNTCQGTGIDPTDRTYEQTVRDDELNNGFHKAATEGDNE